MKLSIMLYVDRAIGEFRKRVASIIAVTGGHVKHSVQMFKMTPLHCND